MLVEARQTKMEHDGYSKTYKVTFEVYLDTDLAISFSEFPYIYIRNKEEKSDMCCPECGRSLA